MDMRDDTSHHATRDTLCLWCIIVHGNYLANRSSVRSWSLIFGRKHLLCTPSDSEALHTKCFLCTSLVSNSKLIDLIQC